MKLLKKLLLLVVVLALLLGLVELGADLWIEHGADDEQFKRYADREQLDAAQAAGRLPLPRYSPHRYLEYFPTPDFVEGDDRHDALGYRGRGFPLAKPAGELRVVCTGGSTTYSTGVGAPETAYPGALETALHAKGHDEVRVINAGCGAWSTWEMLVNLELRVLDLDPDILVIYEGINDVHPRLVWPAEAYRGDNSGMRRANFDAGLLEPALLERCALWRIVQVNRGTLLPAADITRTIDTMAATYQGDLFREQWTHGTYPSGPFTKVSAEAMLDSNPPTYYRRNVESMVAICLAHDIVPVLATFKFVPEFTRQIVGSPAYIRAIGETNAVLAEIAAEHDVLLFDFAVAMPSDKNLFTDGRHTNEEGGRVMGKLFADFLVDEGVLARAAEARTLTPAEEAALRAKKKKAPPR